MGMYRDSQLGLCIDLNGADGNVFYILAVAADLATQLGVKEEWKESVKAAGIMGANYVVILNLFREFFPVVTLIGYDEVIERSTDGETLPISCYRDYADWLRQRK